MRVTCRSTSGSFSFLLLAALFLAVSGRASGQATPAQPLLVGVLGDDGVLFPVARYDAGGWSLLWPEPADSPLPSSPSVPARWYVHRLGADPMPVQVREVVITETFCQKAWGLVTDWPDRSERRPRFTRRIVAMAATQPLDLLPDSIIPGVGLLSVRMGLTLESRGRGEAFFRHEPLAYVRLDDGYAAVVLAHGYEGQAREVHWLSGRGSIVLRAAGGGC